MQSVHIATNVVSSNGVLDTTLCDKGCQWLRQVGGFLRVLRFPPPLQADLHDITEILLKVALNTHTPNPISLTSFVLDL